MNLRALSRRELIFRDVIGSTAQGVLEELVSRAREVAPSLQGVDLFSRLWERESLGSTGIGSGVAIPHCKIPGIEDPILVIGVARSGIDFGAVDGEPVRVFFLIASPEDKPAAHLKVLSTISRWVRAVPDLASVLAQADPESLLDSIPDE